MAEGRSASYTTAAQRSMRTCRFLAMGHSPAPSGRCSCLWDAGTHTNACFMPAMARSLLRSKTLDHVPQAGVHTDFFSAAGSQGSWATPEELTKCFKTSFLGSSLYSTLTCFSPFSFPCPKSPPCFHTLSPRCPLPFTDRGTKPHRASALAQLLVQTLHHTKYTGTYLGFGFDSPAGPREQERKTTLVSQRHLLSHLESKALSPSSTGHPEDHPPSKRHAVGCRSVCQNPRHTLVLWAEQKGAWYLLAQAKGQSLLPQRGTRIDTSPSPGSCSWSPSPPVENTMLWLLEDSPAVHPSHSQAVPLCPMLIPAAKLAFIAPG